MPSSRINFMSPANKRLAGILELPSPFGTREKSSQTPSRYLLTALLARKDLKAIVRISRALAKRNIGVLRFDFHRDLAIARATFADTNIESNLSGYSLRKPMAGRTPPSSLFVDWTFSRRCGDDGCGRVNSILSRALSDSRFALVHTAPRRIPWQPKSRNQSLTGSGTVTIGGRTHVIKKQMLDSLRNFDLQERIQRITCPPFNHAFASR